MEVREPQGINEASMIKGWPVISNVRLFLREKLAGGSSDLNGSLL